MGYLSLDTGLVSGPPRYLCVWDHGGLAIHFLPMGLRTSLPSNEVYRVVYHCAGFLIVLIQLQSTIIYPSLSVSLWTSKPSLYLPGLWLLDLGSLGWLPRDAWKSPSENCFSGTIASRRGLYYGAMLGLTQLKIQLSASIIYVYTRWLGQT